MLSALVLSDQVERADGLVRAWLDVDVSDATAASPPVARMQSAIQYARGNGYNMYSGRLEEKWIPLLADVVRRTIVRDETIPIADEVMNNNLFRQTDACREVRGEVLQQLLEKTGELSVAQLTRYVQWVLPNDPEIESQTWRRLADELEDRWEKQEQPGEQYLIGQRLVSVLQGHAPIDDLLAFLRRQLKESNDTYRAAHANTLFNTLLASGGWRSMRTKRWR